jgi:hypothetical protein
MGHSRPDTTQAYTDDLELDDLADVLDQVAEQRHAQASSELETERAEAPEGLESLFGGGGGGGNRTRVRRWLRPIHGLARPPPVTSPIPHRMTVTNDRE